MSVFKKIPRRSVRVRTPPGASVVSEIRVVLFFSREGVSGENIMLRGHYHIDSVCRY